MARVLCGLRDSLACRQEASILKVFRMYSLPYCRTASWVSGCTACRTAVHPPKHQGVQPAVLSYVFLDTRPTCIALSCDDEGPLLQVCMCVKELPDAFVQVLSHARHVLRYILCRGSYAITSACTAHSECMGMGFLLMRT